LKRRVEALEDRCVLAAAPLVPGVALVDTTLNIVTGDGADAVAIIDDGAGNISAVITAPDGSMLTGGGAGVTNVRFVGKGDDVVSYSATAEITNSESLTFLLGSGNASLLLDLAAGASADHLRIGVFGGSGDNAVTATFGAINGTHLGFNSFLGNGTDTADIALTGNLSAGARASFDGQGGGAESFNMTIDADIDLESALAVALNTRGGIDNLNVDFTGLLNGRLNVLVNGGGANDTVGANLTIAEGSTGRLNAAVFGSFGDDTEILNIIDNSLVAGVTAQAQANASVNAHALGLNGRANAALDIETGLTSLRAVIGDLFGTNVLTHTDNVFVLQRPNGTGPLGGLLGRPRG
jgi:hypothetical protein